MIELSRLKQHIQVLNSGDDNSRQQAIHTLKSYEERDWHAVSSESTQLLVEGLKRQLIEGNKRSVICQEILSVLGNIGPHAHPAVPTIIELLKDGVPDSVREEAASALGKIGKKAHDGSERLVQLLGHCRLALALRIVTALRGIGGADQNVRTALKNAWKSTDHSLQGKVFIAVALSNLNIDADGMPAFLALNLITNHDTAMRLVAAESLAFVSKQATDVVPAIILASMHDKDEKVREKAEATLTHLHLTREKAMSICAKQLEESRFAEEALRKSGEVAVPALIEVLSAKNPAATEKAIRILSVFGEKAVAAVSVLTEVLRDRNPDMRLAAAKSLWSITKNADLAVPPLVSLLDESKLGDKDDNTRRQFLQTVIEALGRIGPPASAALPALNSKKKDKNRLVRESAIAAALLISPTSGQ